MDQKLTAVELIAKYTRGTCTPEEADFVEAGFNHALKTNAEIYPAAEIEAADRRMKAAILHYIGIQERGKRPGYLWLKVAAMLFIVTAIAAYFYISHQKQQEQALFASQIQTGGNKAILTLANGIRIDLDSIKPGQFNAETGANLSKTADGQLIYTINDQQTADGPVQYNTIETPKGGQYQVHLPDGTRIWLNAASSIKYPVNYAKAKLRKVQLTGEAYFEVAKLPIPFVVSSPQQEVQVMGTHFNVSAYVDDVYAKTTLLEGSVKVNVPGYPQSYLLKPGEQAVKESAKVVVSILPADLESAVDWKNGQFVFNEEPLGDIMKKLARWYNVQIEFEDEATKEVTFGGSISRYTNISKVLQKLELTGLAHFKLAPNKIIVLK